MSLYRKSIVIAALATLVGCSPAIPLQRKQVDALSRETLPAAVEQTLGRATPTAQFEFIANGNSFLVRHYLLQTGLKKLPIMMCTPSCFTLIRDEPITTQYLVVQRLPSRAMHAWGTVEELSKDADPGISSMMPALKARLEVALTEKK